MTRRRRLLYALRARRAGAHHALKIIQEAERANVPLSWAFALVEQESSFVNCFGHDGGSILWGRSVTRARVGQLLRFVEQGGNSNGVGLTQLTSLSLIVAANLAGGAHRPRYQLRIGFVYFRKVTGGDFDRKAWHYNGDPAYQVRIAAKQRRWHSILVP